MPIAQFPALLPAAPELALILGAMALLMVGVFQREGDARATASASGLISRYSLLLLVLTIVLVATVSAQSIGSTFGGSFIVDDFAVFAKIVILLASLTAIVIWEEYASLNLIARFEYPVLVLLATVGMLIMVSANDLMTLYLGLEMQSLALYVIAAFHRDDNRSVEAGLKYFVLGALASGMFLYGASLIYGFTGSTNFGTIATVLVAAVSHGSPMGITVGLVFVLAGLAFKVAAVPFHMWTPDVYEGAPTPVTAFFSIAPKMAAVALLTRVLTGPMGPLAGQWVQMVILLSIASMLLGGFAAIGQTNIKRLMAYSSIGHVGYALIGLAVAGEALSHVATAAPEQRESLMALATTGLQSLVVYMVVYLVMNLGVFCCILSMRRKNVWLVNIGDLAGLSRHQPVMAAALAVFMFSMAGIPPLAGFFSKLYIFLGAVDAGLFALAIIGVLSSVVSAYYYIRIIKLMYFDAGGEAFDRDIAWEVRWLTLFSMAAIMLFFLVPSWLLAPAASAARALLPNS